MHAAEGEQDNLTRGGEEIWRQNEMHERDNQEDSTAEGETGREDNNPSSYMSRDVLTSKDKYNRLGEANNGQIAEGD